MRMLRLPLAAGLALALGLGLYVVSSTGAEEPAREKVKPKQIKANAAAAQDVDAAALQRTRKTLRMLDDLYKTTVVLVTDTYVEDESSPPAGAAAIAIFDAMKKKGWHDVRLVDATGEPLENDNAPADEFEKQAVGKLKSGESYYEQIVQRDGKDYLRGATPIPVVLQKCVLCHPHYEDAKPGEPIGVLSYTLEIE